MPCSGQWGRTGILVLRLASASCVLRPASRVPRPAPGAALRAACRKWDHPAVQPCSDRRPCGRAADRETAIAMENVWRRACASARASRRASPRVLQSALCSMRNTHAYHSATGPDSSASSFREACGGAGCRTIRCCVGGPLQAASGRWAAAILAPEAKARRTHRLLQKYTRPCRRARLRSVTRLMGSLCLLLANGSCPCCACRRLLHSGQRDLCFMLMILLTLGQAPIRQVLQVRETAAWPPASVPKIAAHRLEGVSSV